jgi:hypothetical protein
MLTSLNKTRLPYCKDTSLTESIGGDIFLRGEGKKKMLGQIKLVDILAR